MTLKRLYVGTVFLLLSIISFFFLNLNRILDQEEEEQPYIKLNQVQGSAISYRGKLYTLNFEQQIQVVHLLNQSKKIDLLPLSIELEKSDWDKITFYLFSNKEESVTSFFLDSNKNLIFFAPEWHPNGYLMEQSHGKLNSLLNQTFDQ